MDVKTLPDYLKDRLKRSVAVVPPKKDDGGGNKKEKGEKGGKGKENGGGGEGDKKKGGDGGAKVMPMPFPVAVPEANRMEYSMYGGYPPYSYRYDMVHAPQLFSDENPNACSIM